MRLKHIHSFGVATALLAGAFVTAARATELPSPPWFGFVPPNVEAAKAAAHTSHLFSKFREKHAKCDAKAVKGLSSAVTDPEDLGKLDADWILCLAEAQAYFVEARGKLIAKGLLPTCISPAEMNTLADEQEMMVDLLSPLIFCDGAPALDSVTGLRLPTNAAFAKGEVGVAKALSKLQASARKCLNKGALVIVKLGEPSTGLAYTNECLARVNLKASDAFGKHALKGELPTCLSVAQATSLANTTLLATAAFDGQIYCASPGAAFVDGDATF